MAGWCWESRDRDHKLSMQWSNSSCTSTLMSMEKSTKIDNDICETHVQSLSSHWWLDICGIELDPLFLCKHLSVDLSYISMCTLNMEWIRKDRSLPSIDVYALTPSVVNDVYALSPSVVNVTKVAFTQCHIMPHKMVVYLLKKYFYCSSSHV